MGELTFVACGAPLAARAAEVVDLLRERWSVSVVVTDAAGQWCDLPSEHGRPYPDAVVACPLTFNTANKVAAGIMDTSASGALCDALGAGVPVVVVPMVNNRLWGHPAWSSTLHTLTGAGVRFLDPHTGEVGEPKLVQSGTGPDIVAAFDPAWVVAAIG